ncbi:FAD-binding protein [Streptomyces sp. KL116D]|uniref:FAD-binding protein n=1 Tax=Streptomyces sp. KL116D TaxID=3045152 RepID=UPI003558FE49
MTVTVPLDEIEAFHDVVVVGSGRPAWSPRYAPRTPATGSLVLEKAERLGGTSAAGGGVMWAPDNHLMRAAGHVDCAETAAAYLRAGTEGRMDETEIDWYLRTLPRRRPLPRRAHPRRLPASRPPRLPPRVAWCRHWTRLWTTPPSTRPPAPAWPRHCARRRTSRS